MSTLHKISDQAKKCLRKITNFAAFLVCWFHSPFHFLKLEDGFPAGSAFSNSDQRRYTFHGCFLNSSPETLNAACRNKSIGSVESWGDPKLPKRFNLTWMSIKYLYLKCVRLSDILIVSRYKSNVLC